MEVGAEGRGFFFFGGGVASTFCLQVWESVVSPGLAGGGGGGGGGAVIPVCPVNNTRGGCFMARAAPRFLLFSI